MKLPTHTIVILHADHDMAAFGLSFVQKYFSPPRCKWPWLNWIGEQQGHMNFGKIFTSFVYLA